MEMQQYASELKFIHLNDDCLQRVFIHLNLGEQFTLLELHPKFERIVRCLWRRKYLQFIDFRSEIVSNSSQQQTQKSFRRLFTILCKITFELRSLNALPLWLLRQLNSKGAAAYGCSKFEFSNIQRISIFRAETTMHTTWLNLHMSFPYLQSLQLHHQQFSLRCIVSLRNLRNLQLVHCCIEHPSWTTTWSDVFRQLRLHKLTYIDDASLQVGGRPSVENDDAITLWRALKNNSNALCILELNALLHETPTLLAIISALPYLRQLTIFMPDNEHFSSLPSEIVMGIRQTSSEARLVGMRLKCHFDRRLFQQCAALSKLRKLAWHTQLKINYDKETGTLQWRAHDPQIAKSLLYFAETCNRTFTMVDLRSNCHATPEYIFKLQQRHQKRLNAFRDANDDIDMPLIELQVITDDSDDHKIDFDFDIGSDIDINTKNNNINTTNTNEMECRIESDCCENYLTTLEYFQLQFETTA